MQQYTVSTKRVKNENKGEWMWIKDKKKNYRKIKAI